MARRKSGDLSLSLAQGRDRFEQWRRGRKVGARIPGTLWTLAVRLAEAHGVSRTAAALRLDYNSLKDHVEAKNEAATSMPATFIEGAPPQPTADRECVVELDDGRGARCGSVCGAAKHPIWSLFAAASGADSDVADHAADEDSGGCRAG